MITVVALGLAALAVLAMVVGMIDTANAAQWRSIARDRRALWEQRQREERLSVSREQFPE